MMYLKGSWIIKWIFKRLTTLRISTRASQPSRNKILLSKQTRARRRKFWLRALVRKKKKKTMKENMMKMKWIYSSRNSTSSWRKEGLTKEKGRRSQGQIGCATIVARIDISLPNAHMRGRKKTMTTERSLTKATKKTRNILRRCIMVKFMLDKNGTQVMRVPNQKAMTWQP
jgi:hypothetical protein